VLEARPSNHRLAQENCQRKNDLSVPVEPCGETSLSSAVPFEQEFILLTLAQKGLEKY